MLVRRRAPLLALSVVACATLLGCPLVLGVDGTFELRDGDAGSDAPTALPFCASLHPAPRFCDDFDGIPLAAKWDEVKVLDAGGVAVDTAIARSSPRALRSWINGGRVGSGCDYATVATTLTGPAQATHLGYAVRFGDDSPRPDRDNAAHISSQMVGTGGDLCSVIVDLSASQLSVEEQVLINQPPSSRNGAHIATRSIPPRQWARIEIDVDYVAKRLVLTLDGQRVIDDVLALTCPYVGRPASALVGLYCAPNAADATSVRYDDVVFDAR